MNGYFGEDNTNYTSFVNLQMKEFFGKKKYGAIFGQNIISGSRISGLGNNLDNLNNVKAINATNSENSLMGLGLGLALEGVPAIFLMKQHDFALLGLDQLTNTVNLISSQGFKESFIVLMVVVDSGYEGPQSSLNNIDDFASLTRSPIYLLNSKESIENAFVNAETPGLHMMVLSQKTMKKPLVNNIGGIQKIGSLIKYQKNSDGHKAENLIIYTGINLELLNRVIELSFEDEIFFDIMVVSDISPKSELDYNDYFTDYRKIAIIHDSKSIFTASHYMATKIDISNKRIRIFTRQASNIWATTNSDVPEYSAEDIVSFLAI
jgi:pyruvate dehydrogenase E1 component beta subunit